MTASPAVRSRAGRRALLLVWLALHPGRQPRTLVAARSVAARARGFGAHQPAGRLSALRRALGADAERVLVTDRRDARPGAGRAGRPRPAGELAPGLAGDWLAGERERAPRAVVAHAWRRAASALEADGDLPGAAGQARERVERDPFSESAVRELVRFTWLAGDRTGGARRLRPVPRAPAAGARRRAVAGDAAADRRARAPARPGRQRLPQVPLPPMLDRTAARAAGRAGATGARRRARRVRADPPGRHRPAARGGRAGHRQDAARGRARDGDVAWDGAAVLAGRVAGGRAGAVPGVGRGARRATWRRCRPRPRPR